MSVTEYERNQLFTWFEEHMGKERASTMMSLLPPVGWGDVATKRDLEAHAAATKRDLEAHAAVTKRDLDALRLDLETHAAATAREFADVRRELHQLADRLDTKIDTLGQRLDVRIDGLATRTELHGLRSDMQRTFVTWMFASQAAVIAAMGAFLALFR